MKLLHFADAHIDMANYGRHDPQTGLALARAGFPEIIGYHRGYGHLRKSGHGYLCGRRLQGPFAGSHLPAGMGATHHPALASGHSNLFAGWQP